MGGSRGGEPDRRNVRTELHERHSRFVKTLFVTSICKNKDSAEASILAMGGRREEWPDSYTLCLFISYCLFMHMERIIGGNESLENIA